MKGGIIDTMSRGCAALTSVSEIFESCLKGIFLVYSYSGYLSCAICSKSSQTLHCPLSHRGPLNFLPLPPPRFCDWTMTAKSTMQILNWSLVIHSNGYNNSSARYQKPHRACTFNKKNMITSLRKPWCHPPWWINLAVSSQLMGVRLPPCICSHNSARTQRYCSAITSSQEKVQTKGMGTQSIQQSTGFFFGNTTIKINIIY